MPAPPADNPPSEYVNDEGKVNKALLGVDKGEITQPQRVRTCGTDLAVRSCGQGSALSRIVVRIVLPRMTPLSPSWRIRRATV